MTPAAPAARVYLSYGEGRHVAQLHFSVLSALRFGVDDTDLHVAVFTDRPEAYGTLPVQLVPVEAEQLARWREPSGATYVVKLEIIRLALQTFGCPCAFVDADTYFRAHPLGLARRLQPGRSVMHLREYRFGDVRPRALFAELFDAEFSAVDGGPLRFDRRAATWNAGVTGVHPADSRAIDEAIHLTHQVERRIPGTGWSEQLSVGHCLNRRTTIMPADDIVYHYWPYVVSPELQHLPELVEATEHLPAQTRGTTLMRHAFRPPPHRRARRVLEAAGLLARAPRFSL